MTKIQTHHDLEVFQKAMEAAMSIFQLSKTFPREETYSLTDQIRRCSRSVCANLAAAEGHPPSVMDMSFATQALTTEYCVQNKGKLDARVHPVPAKVEEFVARHKLASMGIEIDQLTSQQMRYRSGWEQGT